MKCELCKYFKRKENRKRIGSCTAEDGKMADRMPDDDCQFSRVANTFDRPFENVEEAYEAFRSQFYGKDEAIRTLEDFKDFLNEYRGTGDMPLEYGKDWDILDWFSLWFLFEDTEGGNDWVYGTDW